MYRLHVQLTPQIHDGQMKYYWHIDLHSDEGNFTVKHGWAETFFRAQSESSHHARAMGLIK